MREVSRLFHDYKENIVALRKYEQQQILEETINVGVSRTDFEKVQGGILHKEEKKMTKRIDRSNSSANAIKSIKADLKPFLLSLGKITSEQRELLRSRYIDDKNVKEVAKEFQLTVSVAKNKLEKAEKRFYRLYQNYSKEDTRGII